MNDDLLKRMRVRAEFTGPYSALWDEAADRIEKLERALEKIAVHHRYNEEMASIARKALEGK